MFFKRGFFNKGLTVVLLVLVCMEAKAASILDSMRTAGPSSPALEVIDMQIFNMSGAGIAHKIEEIVRDTALFDKLVDQGLQGVPIGRITEDSLDKLALTSTE